MNVHEHCEGRPYAGKDLLWWASKLRRRTESAARSQTSVVQTTQFAQVVRSTAMQAATPSLVVVQIGRARVEVSHGVDRTTLAMVFDALEMSGSAGAK